MLIEFNLMFINSKELRLHLLNVDESSWISLFFMQHCMNSDEFHCTSMDSDESGRIPMNYDEFQWILVIVG